MSNSTSVSTIIPVHNGEAYLAEAIRSVLDQSQPPVECFVIDDGSTDATKEVAGQFGSEITYVYQDQAGVSRARNRGAEVARGELVAFLDHDDVWLPAKLERQIAALVSQGAAMAVCAMSVIGNGPSVGQVARLRARTDLVTGMVMFDGTETVSCSSTGLVHRASFLAGGGFDPALSMSADWDLLLRTILHGGIAYIDEPLVLYRVHEGNMSRNIALMEKDMRYALAKAFRDPELPPSLRGRRRQAHARLYRMLAGSYRDAGERRAALRALSRALWLDPKLAVDVVGRLRSGARL
jgi:glycosyltransferase involved in cell wall biosynthesis